MKSFTWREVWRHRLAQHALLAPASAEQMASIVGQVCGIHAQIAASAELARAKDSREPVVLIEGLERYCTAEDGPGATALLRPAAEDLFL